MTGKPKKQEMTQRVLERKGRWGWGGGGLLKISKTKKSKSLALCLISSLQCARL